MRVLSESGRASIAVFSVGLKTLEKAGTLPGGVFFMANLILLKRFSEQQGRAEYHSEEHTQYGIPTETQK